MSERIRSLQERQIVLVHYLKNAIDERDWHAVCDAANDLRCVEAELRGLSCDKNAKEKTAHE